MDLYLIVEGSKPEYPVRAKRNRQPVRKSVSRHYQRRHTSPPQPGIEPSQFAWSQRAGSNSVNCWWPHTHYIIYTYKYNIGSTDHCARYRWKCGGSLFDFAGVSSMDLSVSKQLLRQYQRPPGLNESRLLSGVLQARADYTAMSQGSPVRSQLVLVT